MAEMLVKEKEKWINQYSSGHNILLVGEGDFSFSLSLGMAFVSAPNIVATSLDSYDALINKHKNGRSNVATLKSLGATLLYEVDATNMANLPNLQGKKFDRIIFNFPHAGCHGSESSPHSIMLHMNLVCRFLSNASNMLCVDGEVHINHKTSAPFDSWRIVDLALESSLICIGRDKFEIKDYPGYLNKRGSGWKPDESFPVGACTTFKFKLNLAVEENLRKLGVMPSSSHQMFAVPPPKVYHVNSSMDVTVGSDCYDFYDDMMLGFETEVPLFSVENCHYWQIRMKAFLSSIDYQMWSSIIEDGPIMKINTGVGGDPNVKIGALVPKPRREMSPVERQLSHLDAVAKNILISSVSNSVLRKLVPCKSAKDMWNTLALMCDQIKEKKLPIAVHKFEHFKMLPDENIDQLDARFNSIMNEIILLGKEYTKREVSLKILRSLPSKWKTKAIAILVSKDLSKMSTEELFSELKAYEFDLEEMEENNEPSTSNKTVAYKVKSRRAELKDEMAMVIQRFEKLNSQYKKNYNDNKDKRNKHRKSSP